MYFTIGNIVDSGTFAMVRKGFLKKDEVVAILIVDLSKRCHITLKIATTNHCHHRYYDHIYLLMTC